jgi:hypothetical protein
MGDFDNLDNRFLSRDKKKKIKNEFFFIDVFFYF